jgi:rhamnosyltransferase subunit B
VPSGLSILLAPFGSEGDVRPLLWLAEGLAARGHRITFLITPYYGELVAARGWRWLPLGTAEGFAATMRDPRLWQPRHGSELVLREMLGSLPRCQAALDGAGGRFDLVIGTTLAAGVFTWAEKNGVPRLMTHLQPMCLRSMGDCPVFLEGWEWLSAAPAFVKRGAFWLIDQALIRLLLPPLNAHRATLGLRRCSPPGMRLSSRTGRGTCGNSDFRFRPRILVRRRHCPLNWKHFLPPASRPFCGRMAPLICIRKNLPPARSLRRRSSARAVCWSARRFRTSLQPPREISWH